ncbi:hypothetical protein MLD38_031234 [Melastoma candidum]|uniref:Uncharacterized protein n=1 Tax=Melastoma candidum TaxID=119954 RepID=A0ACB9MNP2_9MYRT|nr:hypothetical protein MLD38_031234 [Melastoma candidum]
MQSQVHSLYIEAEFIEVSVKKVLDDNGATVNVMSLRTLKYLGYDNADVTNTDVAITGFNGLMSKFVIIFPLKLKVGRSTMNTAFFKVDVDATFIALLGRDWLHKAAVIPSILHRELMLWLDSEVDVVKADSSINTCFNPVEIYTGNIIGAVNDMSMKKRYSLGDSNVGPLGESTGKFEYLVKYGGPPHPIVDAPFGWDYDVVPPVVEAEAQAKKEVELAGILHSIKEAAGLLPTVEEENA